ncbi:hypothetical protein J132_07841 [Termitomyces sp. J132]|nr:hypothetical protein J132_07841 [Termitomyces sp. J132]
MGVLSTMASDVLDVYVGLLLMKLLFKKVLFRAVVRLSFLPTTHPVSSIVCQAASCFVSQHKSPLHNLFHFTEVDLKRIETVDPVCHRPNYSPAFATDIGPDKDNALTIADETFCSTHMSVYCNGSGFEGGIVAVAVLYVGGKKSASLKYHLGPALEHTVYKGEIVGFIMGLYLLTQIAHILTS